MSRQQSLVRAFACSGVEADKAWLACMHTHRTRSATRIRAASTATSSAWRRRTRRRSSRSCRRSSTCAASATTTPPSTARCARPALPSRRHLSPLPFPCSLSSAHNGFHSRWKSCRSRQGACGANESQACIHQGRAIACENIAAAEQAAVEHVSQQHACKWQRRMLRGRR
jgi:hypothetical protein